MSIDQIEANPAQPAQLQMAMLVYPGFTLLDLAGPQAALGPYGRTHLVWRTLEPVLTDSGVSVLPTTTFRDCPDDLDALFVPGGMGTAEVMEDDEALRFLAERGRRARYITSVCSGSLILAAARLLDGFKAATHWTSYEVLEALGVEVDRRRVVMDRNRWSGGGVTAGIDFGISLLAELRGETVAKITQLAMEYDPKPPFDAGSPQAAGPELTAVARSFVADVHERTLRIAREAKRKAAAA